MNAIEHRRLQAIGTLEESLAKTVQVRADLGEQIVIELGGVPDLSMKVRSLCQKFVDQMMAARDAEQQLGKLRTETVTANRWEFAPPAGLNS